MKLQDLFSSVLNMSLTASFVIGFVLVARLLLKKAPKVFSYALWAVVLFRLLCPVSFSSAISLLRFTKAEVTETEGIVTSVEYTPTLDIYQYAPVLNESQAEEPVVHHEKNPSIPENRPDLMPTPDAVSQQASAEPVREPIYYAVIIWLAGIAVMLTFNIISWWRLRRKLIGAVRLRRNIYLADHIPTPFVMGVVRPKIYLPSALEPSERKYIIAHERYHIRRKDHVIKLLAYAALCIHWFNPLVWVAFTLSGKDMEMSCDEAVIRKLGPQIRADYSASLLRLATGHRNIALSPLAFGEGDTKGRVLNMAKWKKPKIWVIVCAAIVCIGVLAACAMNPANKNEQAEPTLPSSPAETSAPSWITEVDPEKACLQAIDALWNAKSYYICYSYEEAGSSGTTEYRRYENNLLSNSGSDWLLGASTIYFDGSYGRFLGDFWVWEEAPSDYDANEWLSRWSPEEKEITAPEGGMVISSKNNVVIQFNAVWPHQLYQDREYHGTFTYTFHSDGSLATIQREYMLVAEEEEAATVVTDQITILEESPEDTYAAIKSIADQCIPESELEQIRYDAKTVTDIPSNKTEFDRNYELGAGTMRWFFLNEAWHFAFGAEDASSTCATLIHQESGDGHKSLVAEEGFWLEELVDGKWRFVDESITNTAMADAPEVSIRVGWDQKDRYQINWLDSYGELKPGYYRIGRNYTVTMESGESETHVCYAKFRVMEEEVDQSLKKCNDALEALLSSDSYHLLVTNRMTEHADKNENGYMSYYMTREIWKSGDDYLEDRRYINRENPSILESRSGSMYRNGVGYSLEWSGDSVTSPLSSWESNTYREAGDFELWTISTSWYDSQVIGIIGDTSSIDIISEYDFDDKYDSTCIALYFDDDGNLAKIESAFLLGPSDKLQEQVVDVTVEILPTSANEIDRVINSQDVSKPVPFSYTSDKAAYPDAKASGFVNTGSGKRISMADAISLAEKECTLSAEERNITRVFHDESAKMWKVEFAYSADDDVWQAIYLNDQGVTKMVITN